MGFLCGCGLGLRLGLEAWELDGEHAGVFGRRSWLSGCGLLGLGILCGCGLGLCLGLEAWELDGEHAGVFGCCGGLGFGCGLCLCFGLEAWELDGEHAGVFGCRSWLSGCGLLGLGFLCGCGLGLRLGLVARELDGEHAGVFGRRRGGLRCRRRNGGCGCCSMGRRDRFRLGCLDRLSSGSRDRCGLVVVGAE